MERVRLSADVEPELRRRVRVAAAASDRKVSDWISEAVKRELDREELENARGASAAISNLSIQSFNRDWDSEDDAVYDQLAD